MSFYDPTAAQDGLDVSLAETTPVIQRFHRTLMDRRQEIDWAFEVDDYDPDLVAEAHRQWSYRAIAEYESTAQFAQLLHRLTLIGAPLEMIGAATRLATDECRHAELCARFADLLGGDRSTVNAKTLRLYDNVENTELACALTILAVCCFGETLSVPMLRSLTVASTDPLALRIAEIIAADEEYHSRFGWEAFGWFVSNMNEYERSEVQRRLPDLLGHFERVCHGSPQVWERLAGTEVEIEASDEPNLGTLPNDGYAAIFYATLDELILPRLEELGFEARNAWNCRIVAA